MGLTLPPEQEGAGSELPAGSASCSHSIPSRRMQLFASSLGSLQPFQQKLPARSRDLAQLAPSSAPFPAFPFCLATSNSCAWWLIDRPWGMRLCSLPFLKRASQQGGISETPETRMLSAWLFPPAGKRELLQDPPLLASRRWTVVLWGTAVMCERWGWCKDPWTWAKC